MGISMSWLSLVSLGLICLVLVVVLFRLFGKEGIREVPMAELTGFRQEQTQRAQMMGMEGAYREITNLADVTLGPEEKVLAACGTRGETEIVLMATTHRAFLFSRRYGTSIYRFEVFDYHNLHPLPISMAVNGERIRLLEGDRMAELKSPGMESWLDTAEDTIKAINMQIKAYKDRPR